MRYAMTSLLLVLFAPTALADAGKWQLFGGLGAGLLGVGGDSFRGSPLGSQLWLGGAVTRAEPRWVLDVGGGWSRGSVGGRDSSGRDAEVRVRSGFVEASPRL